MDGVTDGQVIALGKRLQQARQRAGLTQQQLCSTSGLSYSTLAKIERGAIKSPSIFTVERIADVIGVTLDELVGREQQNGASKTSQKKRSKTGVRFVFFDINGCLVRFYHSAFTAMAEETGVNLSRVESAFWHFNDEICKGELSMKEFNRKFAKKLGVESVDWLPHYLAATEPITEMHDLLAWATEHYRVGLMSNIMPGVIAQMRAHNLLPDVPYDVIIDSSEVHAIKPEAQIYQIAEEKVQLPPQEILLVDDTRANVMAAERKGWSVLWFDDFKPADSAARVRQVLEF